MINIGEMQTDTYKEEVPEHVDKTQEEWDELAYHTQYYYCNKERRQKMRENAKERYRRKKKHVEEIKNDRGCVNCGETEPCCLDFHHLEDKDYNISKMIGDDASLEKIDEEIDKCVVICANCHRKHHAGLINVKDLLGR